MAAASSTSNSKALRREAVDTALAALGLDDKTRLLAGQDLWSLPALPAIGLRSLVMSDGPIGVRGVRWTAADPSVALPSPTALAATWDPELARRAGELLRPRRPAARASTSCSPPRSTCTAPRSAAATSRRTARTRTSPARSAPVTSGASRTAGSPPRSSTSSPTTPRPTASPSTTPSPRAPSRELYLAPFERIVRNAHPWGIMAAYNQVNGSTMTEHRYLQNAVLRGEWGFDGFIVSDWLAARTTVGAITGGLDAAMPGPRTVYGETLADAVRAGEVDEKIVDLAVRNILLLAARVGALESAPPAVPAADLPATVDGDALAREIARRSFVLVRNEVRDGADALPLAPGTTVALSGALARDARVLGGGSALVFPDHVVSPLDGLTAALPARRGRRRLRGRGGAYRGFSPVPPGVVGTTERVESEGFDRTDLKLPGHQDALVHAVAAVNPRTVVVVNSGSPVELPWRNEVAAVLLSWFPGQEAGHALADVLRGQEEPGGRLPTTWPVALADVPVSATTPTNGELPYTEGVFIGYRAWEKAGTAPAYAFGHGLGYTTWEYENDAPNARPAGSPASPGSPRPPAGAWRSPSPSRHAPTRSGTRRRTAGRRSPAPTRSRRPAPWPTSARPPRSTSRPRSGQRTPAPAPAPAPQLSGASALRGLSAPRTRTPCGR
ncbi:Thermostable beta-glucosidase B [Streptomyces microflavus]